MNNSWRNKRNCDGIRGYLEDILEEFLEEFQRICGWTLAWVHGKTPKGLRGGTSRDIPGSILEEIAEEISEGIFRRISKEVL